VIERVRFTGAPVDPQGIRAVIFDFDGVMTDNAVYVDQNGVETVRCSRGDGMGIGRLLASGVYAGVLSKEVNPVVGARCNKLKLPYKQGIDDKVTELEAWMKREGIPRDAVAYVGNDVNDLECLAWAAVGIAVADAEPEILAVTRVHTVRNGGHGAVRDICEWIIAERRS
jgi:YrbI family 3-deoxy-D-manno-octulosonate 8-phosphate phosphatase